MPCLFAAKTNPNFCLRDEYSLDFKSVVRFSLQPMVTPGAIEEFLPATVEVCRDFVQMIGEKVDAEGGGLGSADFLEELKKYFLEVG